MKKHKTRKVDKKAEAKDRGFEERLLPYSDRYDYGYESSRPSNVNILEELVDLASEINDGEN